MNNALLTKFIDKHKRTDIPEFRPGDTIRVHVRIKEGDKERLQAFEGTLIARNNTGMGGTIEREVRARGFRSGAGVDEVGRGALFGSVFAAAVILSENRPIRGLNDSKQLDPERRAVLSERIRERAAAWAVAAVDAATID